MTEKTLEAKARVVRPVSELRPGDSVHFIRRVVSTSWSATVDGAMVLDVTYDDGAVVRYDSEASVPVL